MPATSYNRGHPIVYNNGWRYLDNILVEADPDRPCVRCGKPLIAGRDACLGYIPNVISVCCGHGVEEGFIKFYG
jgi:hypothetical protein